MSDIYSRSPYGNEMPNTSGQGPSAELPPELEGLNWGALAFSWIWGLGNRTYIALLALLPLVNLVMPFVLLFKGNRWAWQNDTWRDLNHFRSVQRNWAIAAAIVYGGGLLFFGGLFVIMFTVMGNLDPVETAKHQAMTNPEITRHVGSPVEVDWWFSGSVNTQNQSGDADVTVFLSGPLGSGALRTVSVRRNGVWIVQKMLLTLDDTGQVIGLTPPGN